MHLPPTPSFSWARLYYTQPLSHPIPPPNSTSEVGGNTGWRAQSFLASAWSSTCLLCGKEHSSQVSSCHMAPPTAQETDWHWCFQSMWWVSYHGRFSQHWAYPVLNLLKVTALFRSPIHSSAWPSAASPLLRWAHSLCSPSRTQCSVSQVTCHRPRKKIIVQVCIQQTSPGYLRDHMAVPCLPSYPLQKKSMPEMKGISPLK